MAVPSVHFFRSFSGPEGQELQVLGMTNVSAQGNALTPRDILQDPDVALGRKEEIAGLKDMAGELRKQLAEVIERLDRLEEEE